MGGFNFLLPDLPHLLELKKAGATDASLEKAEVISFLNLD